MRTILPATLADWIDEPIRSHKTGEHLGAWVPLIFRRYIKILHPVYFSTDVRPGSQSWNDYDRLNRRPPAPEASQFEKVLAQAIENSVVPYASPGPDYRGRRVPWRHLASELGLRITPELSVETLLRCFPDRSMPRHFVGPREGSLDLHTTSAITQVLGEHSVDHACCCWFALMTTTDWQNNLLLECSVAEVERFLIDVPEVRKFSPTYWYPASRSWCVHTDYDTTFTVVGCGDAVADALLARDDLDCVEINELTRMDRRADEANRPVAR